MDLNITELLKLPVKIMLAISIASGVVLFLPNKIITKMYMSDFRDKYGFIIGVVFIISASILIVNCAIEVYKVLHSMYSKRNINKNTKKLLLNLDEYKRVIVYTLYVQDNHTNELPLNDGAVIFLEHMMVIQKATTQYAVSNLVNPIFPYFLQQWVIDKLEEDEELLASYKKDAEKKLKKLEGERANKSYNYY